jgi:uncharacterized membrane-anchored protein YhcB (DUF1043 family)
MDVTTLAQAPAAVNEIFGPWVHIVQGAATGVIAGLLWWVITKHIPKKDQDAQTQVKDLVERFDKISDKDRELSAALAREGTAAVKALSESFRELAVAISADQPALFKRQKREADNHE